MSSFSAVSRVSFPGGYPHRSILFFQASRYGQFLHIAFVHDGDIDSGTLEVVNHKHCDYASTALTLVKVTNTTGLYGDEEEKEMLVFVNILWCVVVIFQYRLNVKNTRASSSYHCFTILRSHKCGIIYTRFHKFLWCRKTGMVKMFFEFLWYVI